MIGKGKSLWTPIKAIIWNIFCHKLEVHTHFIWTPLVTIVPSKASVGQCKANVQYNPFCTEIWEGFDFSICTEKTSVNLQHYPWQNPYVTHMGLAAESQWQKESTKCQHKATSSLTFKIIFLFILCVLKLDRSTNVQSTHVFWCTFKKNKNFVGVLGNTTSDMWILFFMQCLFQIWCVKILDM